MRLSCCAYSFRDAFKAGELTLDDFPALCRRIGCTGAELTSYYFPTTERDYLNALKQTAHREGISISGTAVGSDFANPNEDKRAEHVTMTLDWIEHSVRLGAPTLRVFAGGVRPGQQEAEAFDNVVKALKTCGERAYNNGVILALENHGGLTADSEGVLKLLRAADSKGVGLNLDFGNFATDCYDQFRRCAPFAVAAHAKPVSTGPDGRIAVDYERVRSIMKAAGYHGWMAIEYEEAATTEADVAAFAIRTGLARVGE